MGCWTALGDIMQTLSYGIKKPQDGDKGSTWFPALEDNFQQQNDHDHDGVDSAPIASTNIASVQQSLSAANWVAVSGGTYRQLVTVPNGKLYDNSFILFRNTADKSQMLLGVEKVSSTTYYVYINDSTIDVTAYYVS
jgi:hypothetical protein